jgi:hypothetical protein
MKSKFAREAAAVAHWSAQSTFWPELCEFHKASQLISLAP